MKRRSVLQTWLRAIFFTAAVIILTKCGNPVTNPPTVIGTSGTFTSVYATTLKTACIQCHVPGGTATVQGVTLDFTSQTTAYQTLSTSTVSGGSSANICSGVKIVKASDPTKSYLAAVLFTDYNKNDFGGKTGCQPYTVHLQDQNLTTAEKNSILAWINAGALNN